LQARALDGYVTAIVGAESVTSGKPTPVPYQVALARTGADPRLSIAVEDSPSGVASARGAGLFTLVLAPDGAAPPAPATAGGALGGFAIIGSLREVLPRIVGDRRDERA
jgi:beta-phosphoglucomutase-like phosphatase (HAD superfamily)